MAAARKPASETADGGHRMRPPHVRAHAPLEADVTRTRAQVQPPGAVAQRGCRGDAGKSSCRGQ
eukprot:14275403-Alexandrium_andersonii.AAC.2